MKKKLFLVAVSLLTMSAHIVAGEPDVWDGTTRTAFDITNKGDSASPYLINSAAELAYLAQQVFDGEDLYAGKFFKLTTDIDLNGNEWLPIGYHFTNAINHHFKGSFDGDGHKIFNLVISQPIKIQNPTDPSAMIDVSTYALFGAMEGAGRGAELGGTTLKNLGVESGMISVGASVGGLVAWGAGTCIKECYNKASLEGTSYVGGIVAYPVNPSVDVINCYNMGDLKITANATANKAIGGIIGATTTAYILNCYNFGNIVVNGSIPAGTWGGITGTYQASREPINSYYVETCIGGGNSRGTKYTEDEMLDPLFVLTINNDQDPIKWVADDALINYGLPVLFWEADSSTAFDNITETPKSTGAYSILGQYMGNISDLPKGIYIVDGKKIIK